MSVEEKVGQMMLVGFWDFGEDSRALVDRVQKHHLGGVFHFVSTPDEIAHFSRSMKGRTKIPLFVASDYEAGTGWFLKNGTLFPRPMARGWAGTEQSEYHMAHAIAEEGRAVGANFTFSPVVDVNVHPMCPDVNIRAYADEPEVVSRLAAGYIRGIQDQGMLATAKHFPGNGGTFMDQHIPQAINDYARPEFEATFLKPFRDAIAAGVGCIMVAHMEVPCLTTETHPRYKRIVPASMSSEVITDLLKSEMGFEGVVMSDALDMGGVMGMYTRDEANIKAIQAGTDLLLNFFPRDFERDYGSVLCAVRNGSISMERIDDAVRRILRAKTRIGLHEGVPDPESQKVHTNASRPGRGLRTAVISPKRASRYCAIWTQSSRSLMSTVRA